MSIDLTSDRRERFERGEVYNPGWAAISALGVGIIVAIGGLFAIPFYHPISVATYGGGIVLSMIFSYKWFLEQSIEELVAYNIFLQEKRERK